MEINKLQKELSALLGDNRNLCKNCKWAKKDLALSIISLGLNGWKFGKCFRPQPGNHSAIDGSAVGSFLENERRDWGPIDSCGTEGKYFERK